MGELKLSNGRSEPEGWDDGSGGFKEGDVFTFDCSYVTNPNPLLRQPPWTLAEVDALNKHQMETNFFKCGLGHVVLVATPIGWKCLECEKTNG